MKFDWDDKKEKINIQKHGVDFKTASLVFLDKNRIEKYDVSHSSNEDRYITIGMVKGMLTILTIVYTERREVIRIISARAATMKEKEEYYGN